MNILEREKNFDNEQFPLFLLSFYSINQATVRNELKINKSNRLSSHAFVIPVISLFDLFCYHHFPQLPPPLV